jgi:hypothetical protein
MWAATPSCSKATKKTSERECLQLGLAKEHARNQARIRVRLRFSAPKDGQTTIQRFREQAMQTIIQTGHC